NCCFVRDKRQQASRARIIRHSMRRLCDNGWMRTFMMALCLGLTLGAGHAVADTSGKPPPDKTGKTGKTGSAKGKAGGGGKDDGVCDQSGRAQRCRDSKCQAVPVHPVT